jgi:hypothetical protein
MESARSFLDKKGYTIAGETIMAAGLSTALSQIVALSTQATVRDLVCMVTFILESINESTIVERVSEVISTTIGDSLSTQLKALSNLSSKLLEDTDRIGSLADDLEGCIGVFNNAGEYIGEQSKDAVEQMHDTINALQTLIEQIEKFATDMATGAMAPPLTTIYPCIDPFSYAQVTQRHLLATHASTLARSNKRQHQILIESAPGMPDDQGLAKLTEVELVAKANMAFDLMNSKKDLAPAIFQFVGARKLPRGGVILDLNSIESEAWLWRASVRDAFIEKFRGMLHM